MSYFNVVGKSSGSIQIAHEGVWLSSNNVYSRNGEILKGELYLAFTPKRYNSIIEKENPERDRFNQEEYSLLRAKTPNTIAGQFDPNEVVTAQWVQAIYGTSELTFNIGDYVLKTNWLTKNNEFDSRITINTTGIAQLTGRIAILESDEDEQTTRITRLEELVDWDIREEELQESGLFNCGLILYGGRAAGWE